MNNSSKIIITIVTILFVVGGAYFYLVNTNKSSTIRGSENSFGDFLFGNSPNEEENLSPNENFDFGDGTNNTLNESLGNKPPKLRKISQSPVAGFTIFNGEFDVLVRYTEKATGHIYEASTGTLSQKRISNTTIPKIQESVWLDEKSSIIRYLDNGTIKSFYGEVVIEDEENNTVDGKIEGVFLQDNIREIISLEDQILYILSDFNGSIIISAKPNGDNKSQILKSPLGELLIQRPKEGAITLTTKPSSEASGFMYLYDVKSKRLTKLINSTRGLLTSTNKDLSFILFSSSTKNNITLSIYNRVEETTQQASFKTFPEKCVWGESGVDVYCGVPSKITSGSYPDIWYQGIIHFSDSIQKMNLETNIVENIVFPEDLIGIPLDVIKPQLSSDETFLFFINKTNSSLWSIELN